MLVGLLNAGPYLGSALCGCWLSDPLNHYFGRRGVIWISAHFCIWPLIGSAFSHNWQQQLINRLLMGVGMGVKASTVPIYAAENSPAAIRGALVMSWRKLCPPHTPNTITTIATTTLPPDLSY